MVKRSFSVPDDPVGNPGRMVYILSLFKGDDPQAIAGYSYPDRKDAVNDGVEWVDYGLLPHSDAPYLYNGR